MATKLFGGNASLWRGNTAGLGETNFTKVSNVTDLAETGGASNMIDTTNRDDLAISLSMVQRPALIAAVNVTFTIQFNVDDAQHLDMINDAETQVERNYQIRITGSTNKVKFRGFQEAIPKSYPMTDLIKGQTGIACSSRPTYAP